MKAVITTIVLVVLLVGFYFGISNYMTQKAEAEEEIIYTVYVAKNTEQGYIPKHNFEISKPTLKTYIKLCWWDASWLNSGDLLLAFDSDEETWFVKLAGNDPTIREIKNIIHEYGLKCSIP